MRRQPDPGYSSQKTYLDEPDSGGQDGYPANQEERDDGDIRPRIDNEIPKNTSSEPLELNGPRGRTAVRPVRPLAQVRAVSWELSSASATPVKPAEQPKLDVSGWHAVTD